jgi:NADH-quinone oxidoreductase subunit J
MMDAILFYVFAALALGSALVVVGQRHAIYSAFALIVTLCSLSAIYGLLGSPFIAALQLVVYAGAIMVLFLFVIMLLNVGREARDEGERLGLKVGGGILTVVLVLQAGAVLWRAAIAPAPAFDASTHKMAEILFSPRYLYVFEATSILILASIVGAVVLAKKDL